MLKRFNDSRQQEDFSERLKQIHSVELDGQTYPAQFVGAGGFGATVRFTYQERPVILKMYIEAGATTNYRFARERVVHNQLQTTASIKYLPSLNDRQLYLVHDLVEGVLTLSPIKYASEYIGDEVICSMQDMGKGVLMSDWTPIDTNEFGRVFSACAAGIDNFKGVGGADPDRNQFNMIVDASVSDPDYSPVVHIDFGSASLVNFNIFVLINLIRNKEVFQTEVDRFTFLAYVFSRLLNFREDLFPKMGELNVGDFKAICTLLKFSLVGKEKTDSIVKIMRVAKQLTSDELKNRLSAFEQILSGNLPVEADNILMIFMAGVDLTDLITTPLSRLPNQIRWPEALSGFAKQTVNSFDLQPGQILGHPLAPCPMMFLGELDYKDIDAVASCSIYQMAWTMFSKLTGGAIPVPMQHIDKQILEPATTEASYKSLIQTYQDSWRLPAYSIPLINFERYFKEDGKIPFVSFEVFLNAIYCSESVLSKCADDMLLELYNYFEKLFEAIHTQELNGNTEKDRSEYFTASQVVANINRILGVDLTSTLAVEG